MDTKEKLQEALKQAMRAGDDTQKATLRMTLAAIRNAEIERRGDLDEADMLAILQKEVKSRQETAQEARQAGREDLARQAEQEIAVLDQYLPQPLSHAELESMAREAIQEVGASSPQEMGQVMKVLMPRVRGRADGSEVSQIVRELLV
ncbi:MAG TPA: GatB/YqeY domain-containing protein [Anaerolineales bacterium]